MDQQNLFHILRKTLTISIIYFFEYTLIASKQIDADWILSFDGLDNIKEPNIP